MANTPPSCEIEQLPDEHHAAAGDHAGNAPARVVLFQNREQQGGPKVAPARPRKRHDLENDAVFIERDDNAEQRDDEQRDARASMTCFRRILLEDALVNVTRAKATTTR